MPRYACYGLVSGSKYLGEVEAENEAQAEEKAWNLDSSFVSLCHHCSGQIEDPEITTIDVEKMD